MMWRWVLVVSRCGHPVGGGRGAPAGDGTGAALGGPAAGGGEGGRAVSFGAFAIVPSDAGPGRRDGQHRARNHRKVDHIEDRLLAERLQDHRAELSSMRRTLVRMQRLLAPEPGPCSGC
jgi:hypothetical protein